MSSPTPVENRVSTSSAVLLTSLMLLLFSGLAVWTFNQQLVEGTTRQWEQGPWLWWLIPLVPAIVVAVISAQRYTTWQRRREQLRGNR